jgi:hypothetical protein
VKHRTPALSLLTLTLSLAVLSGCGDGIDSLPGTGSGPLTVQMVQPPPQYVQMGSAGIGLAATVNNDKNNAGVTWSCTPVGSCGSFNPATTGYQITTLYTPPTIPPPSNTSVNVPLTITATSVADSSQSASTNVLLQVGSVALLQGQYAFVLEGYASYGMVGSVTLDGNGNIVSGEADASANGFYSTVPSITGTYSLDPTGHGTLAFSLNNTGCCGTFAQTHSITATSSSHLVISEADQFNGLTIGGVGSMDLQTAGPGFSASQVLGGYSFTLIGFSSAAVKAAGGTGLNGCWGGIFTADGVSTISDGVFDGNTVGGAPSYSTVAFSGTFTAPDTNGRGTISTNLNGGTEYAYYLVTPEVLRLTTMTNTGFAGNTGSAYGQGTVGTTNSALTGSYVFGNLGFDVPGNAMGAAGQLTADGGGNISAGVMDLNDSGNSGNLLLGQSLAGSTYSISGSPRGTITGPAGQTYNVYLTDPNLNLLDPNNSTGGGGALFLETDGTYSTIGTVIPQAEPASATLEGAYAILLSDQNNPANSDGGFTGNFGTSSTAPGTFSGEGAFQGTGTNNATLIVGPLEGTFGADTNNAGRFTGSISTTPAFPNGALGGTTPGTEQVSYYLANDSQGFVVEADTVAPVTGWVELQPLPPSANAADGRKARRSRAYSSQTQSHSGTGHPINKPLVH